MLKDINVRFFYEDPDFLDLNEVTHQDFVDIYALAPHARVDIEFYNGYANGVRQLCIILNGSES